MIVVADTSVLLNLCRIQQIDLLQKLFQEIVIPPAVAGEFSRLASHAVRFQGLQLPGWIRQQSVSTVPASLRATPGLDPGELAALALALELRADAILVDERRGHQVAVQLGLRTIGVIGVLLQAKSAGLIPLVRPLLDSLEQDALFWIGSGIRDRVLRIAGER